MSEILLINKDELQEIIQNTARIAGAEGARLALSIIKKPEKDEISEDEAMKLLNCKKRTLAALRSTRSIEYNTATKPYTYSKKSILLHIEQRKVKKVYCK
jgi:hypothetical protein